VLTIRCKLKPSDIQAKAIGDTLIAFADACTWINQNVDPKIKGKIRIQHMVYRDVRNKFELSANLAIRAITQVASNRKTAGENRIKEFKPTNVDYDQRIFQYREADEQVGLTLLHGRVRVPLDIGNYKINLLKGQNPTSATLVKKGSNYCINIQVKSEALDPIEPDGVIGVDLGITDLAVTSKGYKYSGSKVKGPFRNGFNHGISKRIVQSAVETNLAIALENLSGIRQTSNCRIKSLHTWAFYQLK